MEFDRAVLTQLTDLARWRDTGARPGTVSLLDYVGFVGTPDLLVAFAELFLPQLIEHDGSKFLAAGFQASTYDAWKKSGLSASDVQRVMNHLHVSTLIQNQDVSDTMAVEIARSIAIIWNRTLLPEKVQAEAVGTTFDDAAVTFYTVRRREHSSPPT